MVDGAYNGLFRIDYRIINRIVVVDGDLKDTLFISIRSSLISLMQKKTL